MRRIDEAAGVEGCVSERYRLRGSTGSLAAAGVTLIEMQRAGH
ncbi:MAG: hypothetical protein OXM87_09405 [Truepera sp.]|nr:hypothetical protein [Truepera sp.]